MKSTLLLVPALLATAVVSGCSQQQTVPEQKPVNQERCVFTPEQQRNAKGRELGDKIHQNDIRQCNDLVDRLR